MFGKLMSPCMSLLYQETCSPWDYSDFFATISQKYSAELRMNLGCCFFFSVTQLFFLLLYFILHNIQPKNDVINDV